MLLGEFLELTSQISNYCLYSFCLMPCLKEMGIPDPLTCLLRNLHAGQETTVRTRHETTDWFQIGKEVRQGCILSPCLITYMQNQSVSQSLQSPSCVRLFVTPWIAACQASLSITNSQNSLKLTSSWWCHPAISSLVVPFSSCPQSLLASESFPMSQLFAWGGQSAGASALASFLTKKSQGWSPSEWT